MTREQPHDRGDIACQQVLIHDASVFSIQWVVLPSHHAPQLTPERLLQRYLDHVRRSTLGLVRPRAGGAGIEFRLLVTGFSLLTFRGPLLDTTQHGSSATLQICGGILVQARQCHRGQLVFRSQPVGQGIRVTLELSEYCPLLLGSPVPARWRKLLYRLTQAYIHKFVTVRFLARLYRELQGGSRRVRVVAVTVKEGEKT